MSESFTSKNQKPSFRLLRIIVLTTIMVFITWYMIFQFLSARNYAINKNLTIDSLKREKIGSQYAPPVSENYWEKLLKLQKEKAFSYARLKMARNDSVRLTIHLPDSALRLEIRGLVVHTAAIKDFKISPSLLRLPAEVKAEWLSNPLKTTRNYSTIPREPIVIKHAPADTLEAQNSPVLPPEPDDRIVYFTYKTDSNLTLHINQSENGKRKGYLGQRIKRDLIYFRESLGYMIKFRYKPFQHQMEITIDKQDARTIYRALPEFPQIALKLTE